MKKYAFARRGMIPEMNQAYQEYAAEMKRMIKTISDTELSPQDRYLPLLNQFQ